MDEDIDDIDCSTPHEIGKLYIMEKKIGKGSYGTVYSASDARTNQKVAVKVIHSVFATTTDARRTLRELAILRQSDHPNICKLHDALMPPDIDTFEDLWVIQDHGGWDLRRILKNASCIDGWSEMHVKYIVYQMLCGLNYMQSANIVHRDLKPSNLLMNDRCDLKIIDFGLAREIKEEKREFERSSSSSSREDSARFLKNAGVQTPRPLLQRQLTHHVVTRWYRAPELILVQDHYNSAIDMWSVGCILGELLTTLEPGAKSRPLFPGTTCYPLSKDKDDFAPATVKRELSKEQHQLNQIFGLIGTPTHEEIQAIENPYLRSFLEKLEYSEPVDFNEIWPHVDKEALDLMKGMLTFDPRKRISVKDAIENPFFESVRKSDLEFEARNVMHFPWEDMPRLTRNEEKNRLRKLILHEIKLFQNSSCSLSSTSKKDSLMTKKLSALSPSSLENTRNPGLESPKRSIARAKKNRSKSPQKYSTVTSHTKGKGFFGKFRKRTRSLDTEIYHSKIHESVSPGSRARKEKSSNFRTPKNKIKSKSKSCAIC